MRHRDIKRGWLAAAGIALLVVGCGTIATSQPTGKMSGKRDTVNAKRDAKIGDRKGPEKEVYVNPDQKKYYTPSQAKITGYKNEKGKSLIKMTKIPAVYKPTDHLKKREGKRRSQSKLSIPPLSR